MSVLTGQLGLERLIKQTVQLLRVPFSSLYMIFYISTKFNHGIKSLLIPCAQLSSPDNDQQNSGSWSTIFHHMLQKLILSKIKRWPYQKDNIIFITVKKDCFLIFSINHLLLKIETYIE